MKKKLAFVAVVLAVFIAADWMQEILSLFTPYKGLYQRYPFYVPAGLKSLLQCGVVLLAVSLLNRVSLGAAVGEVGLRRSPNVGLLFAAAATLPLWLVFAIVSPLAESFVVPEVFYLSVLSPLAEEVVYRGFAFGLLRRRAGWGFWPAALLPAAVFGWGHAEDAGDLGTGLAIFLLTGVGAVLFAWLYERWGFNLWVPVFLHLSMNLSWNVFDVGESAFAGWLPTVLQVTTMILAIVLTLYGSKRLGRVGDSDQL
jgi:membrane protease YdiL (CAAX protease family)